MGESGYRLEISIFFFYFDGFPKWEMCGIISKEFGLDISHLEEVRGGGATPRPRDVEMDRSSLESLGISHHTDFRRGLVLELSRFVQSEN